MAYWLAKSEPQEFSIDDLKRHRTTQWDCVRNYEARNNLRSMRVGDEILFYHSNCEQTGIAGIARVKKLAYADAAQFNRKSEYFDPKSSKIDPTWWAPDVEFVRKFDKILALDALRNESKLNGMKVLQRGMRLSVQPVTAQHFKIILDLESKNC